MKEDLILIDGIIENLLFINKIKIWMTGYKTDTETIEIKDDPLLKIGEEFLIFASKNKDGTYSIEGGPQGRLFLRDNKATSLQFITDRVPKALDGLGINIEDIDIDIIKDIVILTKEKYPIVQSYMDY